MGGNAAEGKGKKTKKKQRSISTDGKVNGTFMSCMDTISYTFGLLGALVVMLMCHRSKNVAADL